MHAAVSSYAVLLQQDFGDLPEEDQDDYRHTRAHSQLSVSGELER